MANYRKWSCLAGMAFSMLVMPEVALADAAGSCGNGVRWNFTSANNTLVVSGKGDMERQSEMLSLGATKVVVEEGVKSIGKSAFEGFDRLETLILPQSVWSLDADALAQCPSLKYVTIPKQLIGVAKERILSHPTVEKLAVVDNSITWVFSVKKAELHIYGTGVLENLMYEKKVDGADQTIFFPAEMSVKKLIIEQGVSGIEEQVFSGCQSLETASLPTGMLEIGNAAFARCGNLQQVALPKNLATMGDKVFAECSSLLSVSLPESLTAMGNGVFSGCKNLVQANIPVSITTLPKATFAGCASLESITVPDNITAMEPYAFAFCESLKSFVVDPKNEVYAAKGGVLFYKDMKTLVKYPEGKADAAYVIPASVKEIEASAFYGAKFKTVTIPAGIEVIAPRTFRACSNLESILAGTNRFYTTVEGVLMSKDKKELVQYPQNKKNSSYSIPKTVQTIGAYAFSECNNLGIVKIPASVKIIEESAFERCEYLTEVYVDVANANFVSADNVLMSKDNSRLIWYSPRKTDESFVVPDGVVIIDAYAFYKCENLRSLTIPASTTSISNGALMRLTLHSLDCVGRGKLTVGSNDPSKGSVWVTCMREGFDDFLSETKNEEQAVGLSLMAKPNPGYRFEKWSNGDTTERISLPLEGNVSLTADFK